MPARPQNARPILLVLFSPHFASKDKKHCRVQKSYLIILERDRFVNIMGNNVNQNQACNLGCACVVLASLLALHDSPNYRIYFLIDPIRQILQAQGNTHPTRNITAKFRPPPTHPTLGKSGVTNGVLGLFPYFLEGKWTQRPNLINLEGGGVGGGPKLIVIMILNSTAVH